MKRKKHLLSIILIVTLCTGGLYAADSDAKLNELLYPASLGGGTGTTLMQPPQSTLINPASAALEQRMTFQGSYSGIVGSDDASSGWKAHAVSFGHTIPTKVGVFTWNGSFLGSGYETLPTGRQFSLYGSFAKDVYPDTYVGMGVKALLGDGPSYGAAADIGFIRSMSSLFFLEDVNWAMVLHNIGYSGIDSLREPMNSLIGGVDGRVYQRGGFETRLNGDLHWAEFDNLRLNLGLRFLVGDSFQAGIASRFDLRKLLDGKTGEMIPSLSLTYTYRPGATGGESDGEHWTENELQPTLAVAPVSTSLWAFGLGLRVPIGLIDEEAPRINIELSGLNGDSTPENDEEPAGQEEPADAHGPDGAPHDSGEAESSEEQAKADSANDTTERTSRIPRKDGKPDSENDSIQLRLVNDSEKDQEKGVEEKEGESHPSREELQNEVPEAQIYISPNNDGVKDEVSFSFGLSEDRYIMGYEFVVIDEAGQTVRKIENKETRPDERSFRTFFQNLFAVKKGIQVPEKLRWDGTKDDGSLAEDGLYYFFVRAWDDNNNYSESERFSVYVDTRSPYIEIRKVEEGERIFSPNDDGNKDFLPIEQRGTREDLWTAWIEDVNGSKIKTWNWRDSEPPSFRWDGTDDAGKLVPDGVYRYRIESTDRAGNSSRAEYSNIVKNTEPTPVGLSISNSHFSPNGDNILDTVLIETKVPVVRGLEEWELHILDNDNRSRRVYQGQAAPPGTIAFDGRDQQGRILEEGEYHAELSVLYSNGNRPQASSASFILDVSPPEASVRLDSRIFSPNGDGVKDTITFFQESSLEENWHGSITDIDGNVVYQYKWIERANSNVSWDGRNSEGRLMDDGFYFYQLSTVDRAGNHGESERLRFELNTEETEVILTTNYDHFSPNGDGVKDVLELLPRIQGSRRVQDYRMEILDKRDRVILERSGSGNVPERIQWNGFDSAGNRVEDGQYYARMEVTNLNGTRNSAETKKFVVDTVAPRIELELEHPVFSPEGDGRKDTVLISVLDSSEEELWEAEIRDDEGRTVNRLTWTGTAQDFEWDGTDRAGNTVPDGEYSYRVYSTDRAGNSTEATIDSIRVDTEATKIFVTASSDKISPTGNGIYEEIEFSTIINRSEGLNEWMLEIVDASGKVQRSFQGEARVPRKIIWDGRNGDGKIVESEYRARFSAVYE
ncbi:MAG TPA: flagellar motor protein MotB, partial [Sediminispirochaeta sp.]|nr:flagellar motor protein MotB [Sediminispirochaeta sp.]